MECNANRTMREVRLAGFAKSHFIVSGIGFLVLLPLYVLSSQGGMIRSHWCAVFIPVACILMLGYALAGFLSGRKNQWGPFADWKEGLGAFLDPALIAWGWAVLVVLSLFLNAWALMLILFFASLFLASPSSLLVLLVISSPTLQSGWLGFFLAAFLAGGLPPLLFFLGSLLSGKRNARTEDSAEQPECDSNA